MQGTLLCQNTSDPLEITSFPRLTWEHHRADDTSFGWCMGKHSEIYGSLVQTFSEFGWTVKRGYKKLLFPHHMFSIWPLGKCKQFQMFCAYLIVIVWKKKKKYFFHFSRWSSTKREILPFLVSFHCVFLFFFFSCPIQKSPVEYLHGVEDCFKSTSLCLLICHVAMSPLFCCLL